MDVSKAPQLKLYLTDLDARGKTIPDRAHSSYRLLVDGLPEGTPQSVRPVAELGEPLALTVVVQVSPGIQGVFTEAIDGIKRLVAGIAPKSKLGLIAYTDIVVQELKPGDPNKFRRLLDELRIREDAVEVELPDAVRDALEGLDNPRLPHRRAIVVISDGLSANLDFRVFSEVGRRARDKDVAVYSVGFAPLEPSRLRTLYELSKRGGGTFREARNADDLGQAFADLRDELQGQLVLTYGVPKAFDGKLHDFQIELPEGQASNIVSLPLKKFIRKEKHEAWSTSSGWVFAWIAIIVACVTVGVWLLLRRRRQDDAHPVAAIFAEDEEDDEIAEDDEDGDALDDEGETGEREVQSNGVGSRRGAGGGAAASEPGRARRQIDALLNADLQLNADLDAVAAREWAEPDGRQQTASQASQASEQRVAPQQANEPARAAPSPLMPPKGPPARSTASLPVDRAASGDSGAAGSNAFPLPTLPIPDDRQAGDPGESKSKKMSLGAIPHPDDYLQRVTQGVGRSTSARDDASVGAEAVGSVPFGAASVSQRSMEGMGGNGVRKSSFREDEILGIDPSIVPGVEQTGGSSSSRGQFSVDVQASPLVAGSGIPLAPVPMVPVIPDSGDGGLALRDRRTAVLAVEEIQDLDFSAWLVAIDDASLRTIAVHDSFVIGSDPQSDLHLPSKGIAAEHGVIRLDGRGYHLETTGERRETLVRPLNDGDQLRIGPREFLFKVCHRFPERPVGTARLQVLDGMDQSRMLPLQDGVTYAVGSHGSCDLVVRGENVAPRHAVFLRKDRRCIVADLGAEGGVWYRGEHVGQRELRSGDEVSLGTIRLLYSMEDWSR